VVDTEATRGTSRQFARQWHIAAAIVVGAGVMLQFVLSATGTGAVEPHVALGSRIITYISFFTIQRNILLLAMSITLALRPHRREGGIWRVLRLDSVICMMVTGLIFVTVLRGLQDLDGVREVANSLLHYVAPPIAIVGWALFGPRPRITGRVLAGALIFPLLWVAYTLIRGAVVDWYPYPFIDVIEHGYGQVLVNVGGVAVLFAGLGAILWYLDHRLPAAPPGLDR
jgi:hypothetical protein